VTLYLRVGEPTRLTMGSTRVSRVLGGPGKKSTRIEICKNFSTQPSLNPWWARLARGFQPILTALVTKRFTPTYEIDYKETYAPVAIMNTVRVLLSLVAHFDWKLLHKYCTWV